VNILFYTPLDTRCRDIESQAREFERNGHSIFLLTLSPQGVLHENFQSYGYRVEATRSTSRFTYFSILRRLTRFIGFCNRNSIDVVYAHLEPANFVAVLGQYFVKARIIVCRHHSDFARLTGFDRNFSYRLTYRRAKDIIVVSKRAKEYMIKEEGIRQEKIHYIDLAYDFALYEPVNQEKANEIRHRHRAEILLLSIGRLNSFKRQVLCIHLVKQLAEKGLNIKLLILGEGELEGDLRKEATTLGVTDRVYFTGYVNNVLDYMAASDFLVHPSISESSCISVKEAGLAGLLPIVCQGVGDFDDYICHGENGFLVPRQDFVKASILIIKKNEGNSTIRKSAGEKLRRTVLDRFDIRKTAPYYETTFHKDS